MEEIKVGEYARTKEGKILKIKSIHTGNYVVYPVKYIKKTITDVYGNDFKGDVKVRENITLINGTIRIENIAKHSFNLIDLIEVGDIVNGKLIHKVDIRKNSAYIYYGNCKTFTDYQIKTLLTHEQYEERCYKVEV